MVDQYRFQTNFTLSKLEWTQGVREWNIFAGFPSAKQRLSFGAIDGLRGSLQRFWKEENR
jgi:hypothetical protein